MIVENGILKSYDGDMENVVIPDGVRVIAGDCEENEKDSPEIKTDGVFYLPFNASSSIETVKMGNSVEVIGAKAFEHCKNLERVEFSKNLKKIGLSAFLGCEKLKEFSLPVSLEEIDTWAFGLIDIEKISYGGSVWQLEKIITKGAFDNIKTISCSDCEVNFSEKLFYISELTFDGTKSDLKEKHKDSWILRRTKIIHCSDGDFSKK